MHTVLSAALGALLGVVAVHVSARRSTSQPTGAYPDAEAALIGAVLASPAEFRRVVAVEPDAFTWAPHRALWAELFELAVDDDDPANVAEADAEGLPSLQLPFSSEELVARLERDGFLRGVSDDALAARPLSYKKLLNAGGTLLGGVEDRALTGTSTTRTGASAKEPLVRVHEAPSVRRYVAGAVLAAAAMALVGATGASGFALGAAAVLVAGSVITAFVDLDTLYVDQPTLLVMGVGGIALGVGAAGNDLSHHATLAAVSTISIVLTLEVVAFLFRKLRKLDGLGGGDSRLLVPLIAVPVLSTGVVEAGLWGLLAALGLTLIGQFTLMGLGRASRDTRFPWVPYLVCGWPIGWYLASTFGTY